MLVKTCTSNGNNVNVNNDDANQNDGNDSAGSLSVYGVEVRISGPVCKPPGNCWSISDASEQHNALVATSRNSILTSDEEAISGIDAKFWKRGIDSEIESLKEYKTWKIVPRSATNDRNVLTTKRVFVEKQPVD